MRTRMVDAVGATEWDYNARGQEDRSPGSSALNKIKGFILFAYFFGCDILRLRNIPAGCWRMLHSWSRGLKRSQDIQQNLFAVLQHFFVGVAVRMDDLGAQFSNAALQYIFKGLFFFDG
jgi:hypothetical protein